MVMSRLAVVDMFPFIQDFYLFGSLNNIKIQVLVKDKVLFSVVETN